MELENRPPFSCFLKRRKQIQKPYWSFLSFWASWSRFSFPNPKALLFLQWLEKDHDIYNSQHSSQKIIQIANSIFD